MSMVETLRGYEEERLKREKVIADTATPYNFSEAEERLEQIPEQFRPQIEQKLLKLKAADQRSGTDGTVLNPSASQNARREVEDAFRSAYSQMASISYSQEVGREARTEEEISKVEAERSVYEPSDIEVNRRAEILAKEAGSYYTRGRSRQLNVTPAHLETARQQLKDQAMLEFDAELSRLRGEDAPIPESDEDSNETGSSEERIVLK